MSTSDNSCNDKEIDGASKSNDDNVCEVNNMLQNMSTADEEDSIRSVCANCGKEGDDVNNTCNKCKMVKYCNATCKKKHRHKHKQQCERIVAQKHDEELFKQPPPLEDCPICFLQLPSLNPTGSIYMACCGKTICSGCSYAPLYDNQGNKVDNQKCPFCRVPTPASEEETMERYKKRMDAGDAEAIFNLGCHYRDGTTWGYPRNYTKALGLYRRAAELGCADAYCSIGNAYYNGQGVEVDEKKAEHFYELGAIGGDVEARYNLGLDEARAGNIERALKHYMIAVRSGKNESLEAIKLLYSNGHATKEDYTKALQSYQSYLGEIKSTQRDKAAAAYEDCRYY